MKSEFNTTQLEGVNFASFANGTSTLDEFSIFATPNTTVDLNVYVPSLSSTPIEFMVSITPCVVGEVIESGTNYCTKCPFGTFSWDITDTECNPCPSGAICPGINW